LSASGNLNFYIAIALIAGIIVVLAAAFYYDFQISNGHQNDNAIPVATVFVTTVVTVTEQASAITCSNNQTILSNQTNSC